MSGGEEWMRNFISGGFMSFYIGAILRTLCE